MLLIPFCLVRLGVKATLLVGMAAWALRYALFALGNANGLVWMLLVGIGLHGVCYDFFFVSGQIFTDAKAGTHYKGSAQGLITMATYGVGMLIGFSVAGVVSDANVHGGAHDWHTIWLYPAAFAVLVFAVFALIFKNERLADPGNLLVREG
jgi:MFS family permease